MPASHCSWHSHLVSIPANVATWYHCFKRHCLQISKSTVVFYIHLLGTGEVFGLDIQALLPSSKRTQHTFSFNTMYYFKSPLLHCASESSESTVFPCTLYLYKVYIARKVFNQPNNQRSSQEQVISLIWLDMHVCAGKREWEKNSTGIPLHKECSSRQLALQQNLFSTSKQWKY